VRSRLLVSDEGLGESRLYPTAAILTSAALYATLPSRFVAGQSAGVFSVARWIVPALTVLLLIVLLLSEPQSRFAQRFRMSPHDLRVSRRVAALAVIALVSVANGASIVLLVHVLVNGAHAQANLLLRAGIHMWCLNVLVFALWFWQLDNGGPTARVSAGSRRATSCSRSSPIRQPEHPAGVRCSSTICTSRSRTRPPSARPTRCRSRAGRRC
jgi:hypothetical protein